MEYNKTVNNYISNFTDIHENLDYLKLDVICEEFNWEEFFDRYHENYVYEYTAEPVLIKYVIQNNIRHLEYNFTVNDSTFLCIADVVRCKDGLEPISKDITKGNFHKVNTTQLHELQNLYLTNPDKFVIKYQFRDSNNNVLISNTVGNAAFTVLKAAVKTVLSVFTLIGWIMSYVLKAAVKTVLSVFTLIGWIMSYVLRCKSIKLKESV